jgi:hypothetical protein
MEKQAHYSVDNLWTTYDALRDALTQESERV